MNTQTNLFIVDSDTRAATGLEQYLDNKFGNSLTISKFFTGENCLEKIDSNTNLVILAYYLKGKNGNEILKAIKAINAQTEVIILSSNEDIAAAIDAFRMGAKDYVIKGANGWRNVAAHVSKIVMYPVELIVNEFGVSKFLGIFVMALLGLVAVVLLSLKFMP